MTGRDNKNANIAKNYKEYVEGYDIPRLYRNYSYFGNKCRSCLPFAALLFNFTISETFSLYLPY